VAEIKANGIVHRYEIHGGKEDIPLVLIAGMGGAGSFWQPQLDALSRHRTVLVYDQRGTGGTERVTVKSIEQLADDLEALLDALNIPRADMLGHSTGGAIAQVVAARNPDRVGSLMLYASIHRADAYRRRIWGLRKLILEKLGPEVYAQTTTLFFYPPEHVARNDEALKAVEARSASKELAAADIMASRIDAILAFSFEDQLRRIRARTLVCCAKDDMLTPAYFSCEIAALIPGAELTLWNSGGHAFSRSHPGEFNQLALSFLEGANAPAQ